MEVYFVGALLFLMGFILGRLVKTECHTVAEEVKSLGVQVSALSETFRSHDLSQSLVPAVNDLSTKVKKYMDSVLMYQASTDAHRQMCKELALRVDASLSDLTKQVLADYSYQQTVEGLPSHVILHMVEAVVATHKQRGQLKGDSDTRAEVVADQARQILSALPSRAE